MNWSHGTLVTPATPDEPPGLGEDDSIAALLDAAEDIVNEAGSRVLADLEKESSKRRFLKGRGGKGSKGGKSAKKRRRKG